MMRIYICTPTVSNVRDEGDVRARIDELKVRLAARGYEGCSHLDCDADGKWADKVGGNIALLLSCDGVLLDSTRKLSRVCLIEENVARLMPTWKKGFVVLHTKEEYGYIYDNFVI